MRLGEGRLWVEPVVESAKGLNTVGTPDIFTIPAASGSLIQSSKWGQKKTDSTPHAWVTGTARDFSASWRAA